MQVVHSNLQCIRKWSLTRRRLVKVFMCIPFQSRNSFPLSGYNVAEQVAFYFGRGRPQDAVGSSGDGDSDVCRCFDIVRRANIAMRIGTPIAGASRWPPQRVHHTRELYRRVHGGGAMMKEIRVLRMVPSSKDRVESAFHQARGSQSWPPWRFLHLPTVIRVCESNLQKNPRSWVQDDIDLPARLNPRALSAFW